MEFLATHDFHNILVTSPRDHPGIITVTGDIIPGSTSIGILIIFYSLSNNSNIQYNMVEYNELQQPRMYPVVTSLPMDEYKVVFFVVQEDGTPFSRAAATPKTVQIHGKSL